MGKKTELLLTITRELYLFTRKERI